MNMKISRGKQIDNGKWIQGELQIYCTPIRSESGCFIDGIRVMPETLCHFTKRLDRNEKMIFSGHIVRFCDKDSLITFDEPDFYIDDKGFDLFCGTKPKIDEMEIVGNKYNDPEFI
jgi:hypothetical protein